MLIFFDFMVTTVIEKVSHEHISASEEDVIV